MIRFKNKILKDYFIDPSTAIITDRDGNIQEIHISAGRPTIKVEPNRQFRDKIVLAKTSRYCNVFLDWTILKPFAKDIIMVGLEEEWKDFCSQYCKVDFYKCKDALDAAQMIAGAKFMIANQCGLYSLAEQMKTPRILTTAEFISINHKDAGWITVPGPCNVIAQGGKAAMVGTTAKFSATLEEFTR